MRFNARDRTPATRIRRTKVRLVTRLIELLARQPCRRHDRGRDQQPNRSGRHRIRQHDPADPDPRPLGRLHFSDIVDAMRWAAGPHVDGIPDNPNPAKVLNMSPGGGGACNIVYQSAVDDVVSAGSVIVVAAGNSGADAAALSPASCADVITVEAVGRQRRSRVLQQLRPYGRDQRARRRHRRRSHLHDRQRRETSERG